MTAPLHTYLTKHLSFDGDPQQQRSANLSIIEAMCWAAMFGLAENFMIAFAVRYGASALQVSFIPGMSQIGIAAAQLLGVSVVAYIGSRKKLALITNNIQAVCVLFVFFITWLTGSAFWVIIFFFIGIFAANLASPGYLSWINEIVPSSFRGRYWGIRLRLVGFIQFAAVLAAGWILSYAKSKNHEIGGFGIIFIAGAIFRLSCNYPLSRMLENKYSSSPMSAGFSFLGFISRLRTTNFGRFSLFNFLLTFSFNLVIPVTAVFMLRSLGLGYFQYSIIIMSGMVSAFIAATYWGPLCDRYGNYRIYFVTSLIMPFFPLGWIFLNQWWPLLACLSLVGGFIMAGFTISSANYIFDTVKKENLPKVISYFNALNNTAAFAGSVLGGLIASLLPSQGIMRFGFKPHNLEIIFIISCIIRILILIFNQHSFKEVRSVEKSPSAAWLLFYRPAGNIIMAAISIPGKIRQAFEQKK